MEGTKGTVEYEQMDNKCVIGLSGEKIEITVQKQYLKEIMTKKFTNLREM